MVTKFTGQLDVCGMNLGEAEKAEGEMLLTRGWEGRNRNLRHVERKRVNNLTLLDFTRK